MVSVLGIEKHLEYVKTINISKINHIKILWL